MAGLDPSGFIIGAFTAGGVIAAGFISAHGQKDATRQQEAAQGIDEIVALNASLHADLQYKNGELDRAHADNTRLQATIDRMQARLNDERDDNARLRVAQFRADGQRDARERDRGKG